MTTLTKTPALTTQTSLSSKDGDKKKKHAPLPFVKEEGAIQPSYTKRPRLEADGTHVIEVVVPPPAASLPTTTAAVPAGSETTTTTTTTEVVLMGATGTNMITDAPHARADCVLKPYVSPPSLDDKDKEEPPPQTNQDCCPNCYCYVCNDKASACKQWKESHCHAKAGVAKWEKERRNEAHTKATGMQLFDYWEEWHASIETGIYWTTKDGSDQTERAKQIKYIYEDQETFLAALELYNRERCGFRVREIHPTFPPVREYYVRCKWERRELRGHHRKPCSECDMPFELNGGDRYYLIDDANGPWGADKSCLGCMGRNLCYQYGTSKTEILKRLKALRRKQSDDTDKDNMTICYVPYYERQYPELAAQERFMAEFRCRQESLDEKCAEPETKRRYFR